MIDPRALELDGIFQNYESLPWKQIGDLFEQGIGECGFAAVGATRDQDIPALLDCASQLEALRVP